MNFLAHLHLSEGTPSSMIGGIVADFIKPQQFSSLSKDVQRGVQLHRLIDGFTDRHPMVHRSISRIAAKFHWFSGIIIDIYYDHLLARDFGLYSNEPLSTFSVRAYSALTSLLPSVPDEASTFIQIFISDDRLTKYATREGIENTLVRVSDRIAHRMPKRAIRLESAMPDLIEGDSALAEDFRLFYPELVAFADRSKSTGSV